MTAQPASLKAFTDAAADSVARLLATLRRDAQQERELRDAQFAARFAELEARLVAVKELERRLAERLETLRDGEPGSSVTLEDVAPLIEAAVQRLVADMPPPKDGKDADPELIERMVRERVAEAVAEIPAPLNGKDADEDALFARLSGSLAAALEEIRAAVPPLPDIPALVAAAVADIPVPKDGKDADPELMRAMIEEAVSALPPPAPGKDADPEMVAELVGEKVREAVDALPPPEKGEPGPMGALPIVKAWEDRVYYQGEVASHDGALHQATKDTGRAPPHEDWTCIVERGQDGKAADEIEVKATYDRAATYTRLNIVALNGAAFIARKDDPGPCPGEDWQIIAMQGKQGKPGQPGIKGDRGLAVTASVTKAQISDEGLLTLENADGSTVECDLYPVLSRIGQ